MIDEFLLASTHCPRCRGALSSKSGQLNCAACRLKFPEIDGVPWLFAYPDAALVDWRHRAQFQLQTMIAEMHQAEAGAGDAASVSAKERLTAIATGLRANLKTLAELLKPIAVQATTPLPLFEAVKSQLPLNLKLMGYYANLHRDWSWGDAEHKAAKSLIDRAVGSGFKWGRTLVLGAGAGRLAYDISGWGAEIVVALDINPLLVAFGQSMTKGESIKYFEFPIPPVSHRQAAVLSECKAPAGPAKSLHWLMADGMNPPFKTETFDTVVTPWFIDVIPQDLHPLSDHINRILKIGGNWLNFGPYGFLGAPMAKRYSSVEVTEIVGQHGFMVEFDEVSEIPYLQSPYCAQKRVENVLCFAARKARSSNLPLEFKHYPEWMELTNQPVPKTERLGKYGFAAQIQSEVMAMVDGTRSLDDIAKLFASQHKVPPEEALGAVSTLFRQLWDGV